jgi:stage II sporulation protein D
VALEEPVVRIGLGVPPAKVAVAATGRYRVLDRYTRQPLGRPVFEREEVLLVLDRPRAEALATVYRVQVASTADRAAAETLQAQLQARLNEPVSVEYFPDRRTYRVRIGQARTPQEASALAEKLRAEGMEDVWIVEDPAPPEGAQTMRLVDSEYRDTPLGAGGVWVVPEERSERVIVEGSEYRGILEVLIGRAGALAVINHLPLEEYLKGVVPNEMGPGQYPEVEALKAQAVAARTYVYKNLGQFGTDGYDICDSMRCQVYKGYLTEQALTNDAIRETRGEVLTWEGKPINALYTAACGGHTEDGFRVFEEEKGPYLRGVPCYPEREQSRDSVLALSTRRRLPAGDGRRADGIYEAAVLSALGMLPPEAVDRAWLDAAADTADLRAWTFRALRLIGKRPGRHDFASAPIATRAALARYWVQVFSWEERVRRLLSEPDLEGLLAFPDAREVPAADRARVAYLVREGWYEPSSEGRLRPLSAPVRGDTVRTLYRILERYESLGLESGVVLGRRGGALEVRAAGEKTRLSLASDPFLFRRATGTAVGAPELPLRPGDSITYHAGRGGVDLLVLEDPRRGLSDDRFMPNLWWEVRLKREEADKRLRRRVEVGRLVDLVPLEYGPSQRVTRLKVVGNRAESVLTGFRIRVALGLREDLFVLDRQYDADGNVATFVFSGKGWGHGVGLCQVGAYGMALRGKNYRDILSHYYSGAGLEREF